MIDWSIINAPLTTNVADVANLQAAILAARPGTVVALTSAGAPTSITLTGAVKEGMGVIVSLPLTQKVQLTATASSGFQFIGGTYATDEVLGSTLPTNNGVSLTSGCSKFGFYGGIFSRCSNGIQIQDGTDFVIKNMVFDICRADGINGVFARRLSAINNRFLDGARGEKICYFDDGRAPVYGISSSACTAQGGTWLDTTHNDNMQLRSSAEGSHCTDLTLTDNYMTGAAQGINPFGASGPDYFERVVIARNNFDEVDTVNAIYARGTDVEVYSNTATAAATGADPLFRIERLNVGDRIRGGLNSAPNLTGPTVGVANVDLGGSPITGDTMNAAPTLPDIHLPAWAPSIDLPADPEQNVSPYNVSGLRVLPTSGVLVGTWLTARIGQWAGWQGATYEYRWTRNGTPIGGATSSVYQTVLADSGQTVGVDVRGTNATGTGDWFAAETVTVA